MVRRLAVLVRLDSTGALLAGVPVHAEAEFALSSREQRSDARADAAEVSGLRASLGMLVTDHAGFVSFDLDRIRSIVPDRAALLLAAALARGKEEPRSAAHESTEQSDVVLTHLWVALGAHADLADRRSWRDALAEGSGAGTPVVLFHAALPAADRALVVSDPTGRAMQTPSLDEWYLSPGSFAMGPALVLGADGCESLLPSNIATQEFRFRHLVRQAGDPLTLSTAETPTLKSRKLTLHLGSALDYLTTWYPIGHGLGQIAYSLPLAPCESVNIAVIDWSRRDEASRTEDLSVEEQLRHNLLRDRSISETVKATLDEWQRGGSFMAGAAGAAGGSNMGGAASLGGAYTTSAGTRDLAVDTVQNLSDSVAQATNVSRRLDSTIVVQDMQLESATAKTRVVTNHNRAHALTVLYYEVLRHFRVVTEWVAQRPVVFISYDRVDFADAKTSEATILRHRRALQSVLLDSSLSGCFDALQKLACARIDFDPSLIQDPPDQRELTSFELIVRTGTPDTDAYPYITLGAVGGPDITCTVTAPPNGESPPLLVNTARSLPRRVSVLGGPGPELRTIRTAGEENVFTLKPDVRVVWGDIRDLALGATSFVASPPWKVEHLVVKATSGDVVWQLYNGPMPPGKDSIPVTATGNPAPPPTGTVRIPIKPIGGFKTPESTLTADERCCIQRLHDHLVDNTTHYSRAIWLAEDADERAVRLDTFPHPSGQRLLDLIENRPVGTLGNALAFPYGGPGIRPAFPPRERVAIESLASLPTRGVFAEAKLGHCPSAEEYNPNLNAWASTPCEDKATAINPVDLGSRAQTPQLTPSQLPNPVVNIVNPPAAPDPVGLVAALKVLGTPNIFRDMSGVQELSQLLQTLTNAAASLAKPGGGAGGTGQPPHTTPGGGGSGSGGGTGAGGLGTGGAGAGATGTASGSVPAPGTPLNVAEVNDLAAGIRKQLPPGQATPMVGELYQNVVDGSGAATGGNLITDPSKITGVLVPTSSFSLGGDHHCFPVSAFTASNFASGFGTLAERLIENDYCDTFSCTPAMTYLDKNNPTEYRAFLVAHNAALVSPANAAKLAAAFPAVKRPDILHDDSTRKDYYEIKPQSPTGIPDGMIKLVEIIAFMKSLSLPYKPGTTYSPSKDIPIMEGYVLGSHIGVTLNVQRYLPGLVTYSICLEGQVNQLFGKVAVAAFLTWMAAQLLMMSGAGAVFA